MALKGEDVTAQANSDAPANDPSSSNVIYTPPESVASMASSLSDGTASSDPSSATGTANHTSMITATHSPIPVQPPSSANISIREYIYFLPYPLPPGTPIPYSTGLPTKNPLNLPTHQFEPTSTLVLTSPNKTFVDIRLYKPFDVGAAAHPLPNQAEPQRLEWAFSGTSSSRPTTITLPQHGKSAKKLKEERWANVSHATWTHWLDSRYAVGTLVFPVDEGDLYPIAPGLTLEVGSAYHPALGAVKTHEEMWRDVDAVATNKTGSMMCVVLRVQADAAGVRGVVVRVGQYCQGIVMMGESTTVERWEWVKGEDGWKRTARVGGLFLPCGVTFRAEVLVVGGVVKYHDYEWVVEEVWEWE
ncbi:hypothetical protein EJ02DRAFT_375208 [Clathrospora elynae]|uniref:Protein HRI1 n=1 Tax=Clathrospora elynae TaxID=706981 RepID=A0A6A5SQA3_9PLEO|nr:hypothetical protein EJ02DRAFT_375208 [Clathrospora elynae]